MNTVIVSILVVLTCLEDAQSNLRVKRPERILTRPTTRLYGDTELRLMEKYRLPNPELCRELEAAEQKQLQMPWWVFYCTDMKEKEIKNYQAVAKKNKIYMKYRNPYFKRTLDEFNNYKKKVEQSKQYLEKLYAKN